MTHRMVLLASLLTLVSATAAAQRPLTLSLAGGASLPVGRFGDAASTGWHALASIGLSTLMQPIGLRLDVAHNRFTAESVGPDQGVTSATLNATYRLPMTNSPLSPYLITGAGAYRFECFGSIDCGTATRFGWNAGLGTKFAALGMKGFMESRFHAVNASAGNVRFVPLTFGLTF
jgi:hypothetical protein